MITTEPAAPRRIAGRNLPMAVITGAVLAALALISIFVAKGLFAIVAGLVVLLGQLELYTTMQRRGYQPASALGLVSRSRDGRAPTSRARRRCRSSWSCRWS